MPPTHATIPVRLTRISLRPVDMAQMVCPGCGERLDLHQPDAGFPERMLWTCDHCRCWFLMDLIPGEPEAVLVSLPDGNHFIEAMGS